MEEEIFKITGGLLNHAAKDQTNIEGKTGNFVWRIFGELRKKGDWALDTNYQIVCAQAAPDFDLIKRGNAQGIGLYSYGRYGRGHATTNKPAL